MVMIRIIMSGSPLLPFLPANALNRCGAEAITEVPGPEPASDPARGVCDCIRKQQANGGHYVP